MQNNTAKNFVFQLGSLASLYLSLSFLLVLLFGLIDLRFPDPAEGYWAIESASSGVRLGIAMVVVFFPTYLVLTRMVNKIRRAETQGTYLSLTRWLIYLSLFFGGAVLLGDLVAVIMGFLEGELTQRFLLKAFAVLVVIGTAVYYYALDARGIWLKEEQKSVMFGAGAGIIVATAVAFGFAHIETPAEVRERKLDEKQIADLQDIQYRIENYYVVASSTLPDTLSDLSAEAPLPVAPEGREAYEYRLTDKGFALCANFAYPSTPDRYPSQPIFDKTQLIANPYHWEHGSGRVCFERVLN